MEVHSTLQWYPESTITWWTHMWPKLWHRVTSNKHKKCLYETKSPLPTFKVYKTPLLCLDWMWYEFQADGVMQSYNTTAMPGNCPTTTYLLFAHPLAEVCLSSKNNNFIADIDKILGMSTANVMLFWHYVTVLPMCCWSSPHDTNNIPC